MYLSSKIENHRIISYKDTPDIILKLSNLLDYILYQVNKPKVSLKEEIAHIKEYIELEKIRFQDTLKVIFKTDNIPETIQTAPMILIPFVENAFKHGNIIDGFLEIEIAIKFSENSLNFTINNTAFQEESPEVNAGIGLKNIQKRLDILYADNYTLAIFEQEGWYNINLIISNLKSNQSA